MESIQQGVNKFLRILIYILNAIGCQIIITLLIYRDLEHLFNNAFNKRIVIIILGYGITDILAKFIKAKYYMIISVVLNSVVLILCLIALCDVEKQCFISIIAMFMGVIFGAIIINYYLYKVENNKKDTN